MIITGMEEFQSVCKHKLVETYNGDKQELYEDFYVKERNTCYE